MRDSFSIFVTFPCLLSVVNLILSSIVQAKLAPDLVDLLEHHHQPIDPNLLMLASAFQTADTVLKELDSKENDESDALEEILSDFGRENDCPGDEIATGIPPDSNKQLYLGCYGVF